jgi:hypothetical protein
MFCKLSLGLVMGSVSLAMVLVFVLMLLHGQANK